MDGTVTQQCPCEMLEVGTLINLSSKEIFIYSFKRLYLKIGSQRLGKFSVVHRTIHCK